MRSKIRRRVLFFVFSALIMVGLIVGAFADNYDLVGYYSYVEPYNAGSVAVTVSNESQFATSGNYYYHYHINEYPDTSIGIVTGYVGGDPYSVYLTSDSIQTNLYKSATDIVSYTFPLDGSSDIFFYTNEINGVSLVYTNDNLSGQYISCELISFDNTYSIDIYDNSQDVWASVVSVVTDATDSIINNNLLLLFAAAVPVISFGVGMLIRLKFRG